MTSRTAGLIVALATTWLQASGGICAEPASNFVVILCDNLGYGDIGPYGSTLHRTPTLDRLAAEGMRFTDFYVTSGVCTPSRASLMTGCYPRRVNMHLGEFDSIVLQPVTRKGLHPDEVTIAEVLKSRGYATACIGKWHLGDQPPFLPMRQGFDQYFGIPYSDDMTARSEGPNGPWPELPLMRGETVVEAPADRSTLTQRYTRAAIDFIAANKDHPFFLFLSHAMPGSTAAPFASEAFRGKSANGPWGDSVEEIDASTGEILGALKRLELEQNTLVVWTSDNGAPQRNPPQGSNRPLSGWGYTTAEGGMRVPCIVRWPGKIAPGSVCRELCTTMDLLPTFARLAGADLPAAPAIDGHDIWPLLSGEPAARSPYRAFFYYQSDQLQAVRSGKWKLYLALERKVGPGSGGKPSRLALYDLEADLAEAVNLAEREPDVVARLDALASEARRDLGDLGKPGAVQRPAGWVETPHPQRLPER